MPEWRQKGWTNSGSFTPERVPRKKEYGVSMMSRIFRQYKTNAKRRGRSFNLTIEEFKNLIDKDCVYCGTPPSSVMKQHGSHGEYIYNGIDRKDSAKNYDVYNCQTCCKICNRAKSDLSMDEWLTWLGSIRNFKNV